MSNKKNKEKVYSKPEVEKPVEEKIEKESMNIELAEAPKTEHIEETEDFVEEPAPTTEPEVSVEEVIFTIPAPDESGEIKEFPDANILENHVEGEKLAEVLEAHHNVDAVEEFRKMVQAELEKPLGVDAEEELIFTKEQEEEGAKVIAEMVETQILKELKTLATEPPKQRILESLSGAELKHFYRTGQMPK